MTRTIALLLGASMLATPLAAQEARLRPDQARFRALYQELVETDTSITTGDCTALAAKVAGHLKQAGFTDADLTPFSVPDHPKEGGLVAVLPGTDKAAKPMLLLGHIDVVTARRADWTRDPYKMVEENGYFWGRGAADMKAMDAIWIDSLIRMKETGYKPKRTIKLALTCGEETTGAFNGAEWLAQNRPEAVRAAFALNEGGGGRTDGHGKLVVANLHVGEKLAVNYRIEATNPGGHSSAPVKDNAIYELADALAKLRDFDFPAQLSDTTRAYFAKAGAARGDDLGKAMMAFAKNPEDRQAEAVLDADKSYHSMLRTTCVATLLDGGHAENALPQRAGANVNCRIFPGTSPQQVRDALEKVIADPRMTVKLTDDRGGVVAKPPPLDPRIVAPAEKLLAKYYPGVPLVPFMSTGATDGVFLEQIGIPVYGPPGLYSDPDGNGTHGLNEHMAVKAVYTGRDYLFELIKLYAG
jgi:acetylornithine deacetylase/succinyl-diaminopimelate desuccinylase-like protein